MVLIDAARKAWLDSLKVGDEVAVEFHGAMGSSYSIDHVKKITPTHQFRVGETLYNADGEKRDGWNHITMLPVTQEIKDTIRNRNIRRIVSNTKFHELSQDKINRIYAIIKEESK